MGQRAGVFLGGGRGGVVDEGGGGLEPEAAGCGCDGGVGEFGGWGLEGGGLTGWVWGGGIGEGRRRVEARVGMVLRVVGSGIE